MNKITIKKYMGDDECSWAVFRDGKPVVTGLNKQSAKYHREQVKKFLEKRRKL